MKYFRVRISFFRDLPRLIILYVFNLIGLVNCHSVFNLNVCEKRDDLLREKLDL